uniref:Spliceosome-associated protein CWC27 homolog n=1 Tax=Globodera pallida TaxID=36090 RepID=A0A183CBM3_GLOPA
MSSFYINEPATNGKVCLLTTVGDIDIELWAKECPIACRNFMQLCADGYYNGCLFHRIIKNFIVQTGDPTGTGQGGESAYGEPFKTEFHQRLKFDRRGRVATAGEKNMNGSQFFITFDKAPELDGKHTLFGKVVGGTLFNLLKLNDYEVDKNERPIYAHKITGVKILVNPFDDIKLKKVAKDKERKESKKEKHSALSGMAATKRNTSLLSFGDEMDEDDQHIVLLSKSAHDVLEDELLSSESAVKPEELGIGPREEEEGEERHREERLGRVKRKLQDEREGKKVKFAEEGGAGHDEDLDQLVDEQKEAQRREEMGKISSELKQLQKEYKKAVRGPKEVKEDEEATATDGMKMYNKLKLKFKTGIKGIVKTVDPKREEQTIALLDRFQTTLERATVREILFDKTVDLSDQKSREHIILATSEEQGKIDLDAQDIQGDEWMDHELVAPEDTSGVTKAKDANMKESNNDWYPTDDPRNRMNVLRRTQGGAVPDLFKGAEPMALP